MTSFPVTGSGILSLYPWSQCWVGNHKCWVVSQLQQIGMEGIDNMLSHFGFQFIPIANWVRLSLLFSLYILKISTTYWSYFLPIGTYKNCVLKIYTNNALQYSTWDKIANHQGTNFLTKLIYLVWDKVKKNSFKLLLEREHSK